MLSTRTKFILEVAIPTFSVVCLLGVTLYVTVDAINVLSDTSGHQEEVNVVYLYGFAAGNLLVDALSSYVFFMDGAGKSVFYTQVVSKYYEDVTLDNSGPETRITEETISSSNSNSQMNVSKVNLNMISAFTHLTGDSMRTLSVFIAAFVSTFAGIPSQICDAWAAVAVTVTIVIMVIPLVLEIHKAFLKYR